MSGGGGAAAGAGRPGAEEAEQRSDEEDGAGASPPPPGGAPGRRVQPGRGGGWLASHRKGLGKAAVGCECQSSANERVALRLGCGFGANYPGLSLLCIAVVVHGSGWRHRTIGCSSPAVSSDVISPTQLNSNWCLLESSILTDIIHES